MPDNTAISNGSLSIESDNIFTILKKWLYTEQDIVFREIVSNASDAIEKRTVTDPGAPAGEITVAVEPDRGCIVISDNGIGMTVAEVDDYINRIAFSGAADFIEKNHGGVEASVIGHFGVGFYSSFMIADSVVIETLSCAPEAEAVRWECGADMRFSMSAGSRTEPGTDVILRVPDDCPYLTDSNAAYEILRKYFIFLKTPVRLNAPGESGYAGELVNDTSPIWKIRGAHEGTPEDDAAMAGFYKEFFDDILDPLFSVRFESIDIGVSGVIFFRNTKNGKEEIDGKFKIYSRGVYIGDNIPSLIPKFVGLQSGIIDCRDLPLLVSRGDIRDAGNDTGDAEAPELIYETLTQEVTIAVNDLFTNDRAAYEAMWPHLNAFVKYSILQDKVFASVMTRRVIFEDLYGKYYTISEYRESLGAPPQGEPGQDSVTISYVTEPVEQAHYIELFRRNGMNALIFDHVIDQPFLRKQELVHPNTRFVRIDSDTQELFKGAADGADEQAVSALEEKFRAALGSRLDNLTLNITSLETDVINVLVVHDEKSRRMTDMLEMYGMMSGMDTAAREAQSGSALLVNMNNDVIRYVLGADEDRAGFIIKQLFDLAMLSQGALNLEDVETFIQRSETLLGSMITK